MVMPCRSRDYSFWVHRNAASLLLFPLYKDCTDIHFLVIVLCSLERQVEPPLRMTRMVLFSELHERGIRGRD